MLNQMKKTLFLLLLSFYVASGYSQTNKTWTPATQQNVKPSKNIQRLSFPATVSLYNGNVESLKQILQNAPSRNLSLRQSGVVIALPNTQGIIEKFEVFEASNFAADLQSQFPHIRSYAGTGIDDPRAILRMSVDPAGMQAMVFRTDKRNEFIEPYSEDGKIYAVYNSSRQKGKLPFTCSTQDVVVAHQLGNKVNSAFSNTSELLTFRLALSCNAEYTTYFGGTIAGALAAMNASMTRVNGVFEKDFAIHMDMVDNTSVIYTDASTDPYTSMGQWNGQLQSTLTANIGEANYDIGHLFGATGGGGNAGCIGCVCVNNQKGSGITSPADGIPMGDNFDIDYVAHEMGHQFGGNHTFSNSVEGTDVNVEPGSGSTIMGYAGITGQDIANHSDDYFVYASIKQVQDNMVGKTCPVRTPLANLPPVVNAGIDYLIPISTPFILTGSGTDANADPIAYCWEQNDTATTQTGANSQASPTKTGGPNWRSYTPVASPSRYFPPLVRVVNNQLTSVFGSITTEAVSSVGRILNFALTGKDNVAGAGQTGTDFMKVTTVAAAGPFLVTAPNTNVSIVGGSNLNVTWNVAGTTTNGINALSVDVFLSTDCGLTYPVQLASQVPNDGSETVTIPDLPGTTNRVMVRGHNHIFYDISNVNFTITTAASTFTLAIMGDQTLTACQGTAIVYTINYGAINGFSGTTDFVASGQPAGAAVAFSPNSITANGDVTVTVSNTNSATPGLYPITVTGTSGSEIKTITLYLQLYSATFATTILNTPADQAITQNTTLDLTWTADANATLYDVEIATDDAFANVIEAVTVNTNAYTVSGLTDATFYYWRILPKNISCSGSFSNSFSFQTGVVQCNVINATNVPVAIAASGTPTITSTIVIATGSGVSISDLNVTMNITHTWINDLTATLISPAGTMVRLVARPCTSVTINNIIATFDDAGIVVVCSNNPGISGTVKSVDLLSAFNGENTEGTWTMRIADGFNLDGGALNSWSLNVCNTAPLLAVAQNEFTNFSLYPNPNKGNFSIQCKTNADNEINVKVHDVSGRQIFSQSFKSQRLFNESIQLNHAAKGIYLVTVENGTSKEVRKIVIE